MLLAKWMSVETVESECESRCQLAEAAMSDSISPELESANIFWLKPISSSTNHARGLNEFHVMIKALALHSSSMSFPFDDEKIKGKPFLLFSISNYFLSRSAGHNLRIKLSKKNCN